jgi:hypothetical protein
MGPEGAGQHQERRRACSGGPEEPVAQAAARCGALRASASPGPKHKSRLSERAGEGCRGRQGIHAGRTPRVFPLPPRVPSSPYRLMASSAAAAPPVSACCCVAPLLSPMGRVCSKWVRATADLPKNGKKTAKCPAPRPARHPPPARFRGRDAVRSRRGLSAPLTAAHLPRRHSPTRRPQSDTLDPHPRPPPASPPLTRPPP